jgi:eukaryotic-like serine/threonine-protein kinase
MALASGTKLGPYEIQSPLGAGGMGEVYLANDTRLDRTVAIKVLPQHLSSNPDLKQRFEREARAISSLNHPRICTLHDVGHQDGIDFLVMEYLEGETLAQRLKKGALPLKETLRIGIEICEALDKAHRAGIVHRDLKPGNVMLTRNGAKLMDFGLAKAAVAGLGSAASRTPLLSAAQTMSEASPLSPLTTAGALIGTIQYMAPEQIEGKEAPTWYRLGDSGCGFFLRRVGRTTGLRIHLPCRLWGYFGDRKSGRRFAACSGGACCVCRLESGWQAAGDGGEFGQRCPARISAGACAVSAE